MKRTTVIEMIGDTFKHAIYGGVVITLAWLTLCGVIVAQTGTTTGISDVGLATTCLAHEVITEPTRTLASMVRASTDPQQADQLVSACRAVST